MTYAWRPACPAYRRDLATLDALRPCLARLSKLSQRGDDTQMAVGSDLMTNALEGYAVLKVTGKGGRAWRSCAGCSPPASPAARVRLRRRSPQPSPRRPDRRPHGNTLHEESRVAGLFFG